MTCKGGLHNFLKNHLAPACSRREFKFLEDDLDFINSFLMPWPQLHFAPPVLSPALEQVVDGWTTDNSTLTGSPRTVSAVSVEDFSDCTLRSAIAEFCPETRFEWYEHQS